MQYRMKSFSLAVESNEMVELYLCGSLLMI